MFWRRRVRPVWRGKGWLIIGVLACAALVLGFVGYSREEHEGWEVSAYWAFQLFGLEAQPVADPNAALVTAQWLAPLVAAAAAVQAVATIFREQLQLIGLRIFSRDLRVVAGLGTIGFRLATALHEEGRKLVAVESDLQNPAIAGCRERGIPVVKGNAADPEVLARTRLHRARGMFVACGDDGVNLDVVRAAARVVRRPGRLRVGVHLSDLALWRPLQAQVLSVGEPFPFRLEFFSVHEIAARVLIDQHPALPEPVEGTVRRPHALFVGLGEIGEFAVLQVAGRWRNGRPGAGESLRVSVVGPQAGEELRDLRERYPALGDICTLACEAIDVDAPRFSWERLDCLNLGGAPVTAAYVCLPSQTDRLLATLALRRLPQMSGAPIVVVLEDEEAGIVNLAGGGGDGTAGGVAEFGVLQRALVADVALGTNELLARLRHEDYLRGERRRGQTPATNPSMVAWEDLPESLRESNRAFADGIGRKLADYGWAVVPEPLAEANGAAPIFVGDDVEELAKEEHDRWTRDLRRDGWTATTGPKDPVRKRHPLMVDWEQLGEADRDRDRESIVGLPSMLARAGFAIERASPERGGGQSM